MKDSRPPTPLRKPPSPDENGPPNEAGNFEYWLKSLPQKIVRVEVVMPEKPPTPSPRERIVVHSLEEIVVELRKHGGVMDPQPELRLPPAPPAIEEGEEEASSEPWSWWKGQLRENLETCRPDLLEALEKAGTLEEYLGYQENRAIEMARQLKKDGLADDQIMELIIDDLFLREKQEPEEDEQDL